MQPLKILWFRKWLSLVWGAIFLSAWYLYMQVLVHPGRKTKHSLWIFKRKHVFICLKSIVTKHPSILWFISWMALMARAGPGCSREPGPPFQCSLYLTGHEHFEPSSAAFPSELARNWIGNAPTWTQTKLSFTGVVYDTLTHCSTTLAPRYGFIKILLTGCPGLPSPALGVGKTIRLRMFWINLHN